MGAINVDNTGSGGAITLSSDGTDLLLGGSAIGGGGGASALTLADKTGNYTVVAGDLGKILTFSGSGTGTFTLTAAATLGSGWFCYIVDNGTATANQLTIDPNGSETINLKTTYVFAAGGGIKLICDGSNFFTEQPSFDNSIAINKPAAFSKAVATGYGAIAISTGQSSGNGAYGQSSVVINAGTGSAGNDAVAIGSGPTYATGSKSLAMVGGNASGMEALALGLGYASGENATAINISSWSSSYGATSLHSIAFGNLTKATGEHSISLGKQNIASGSRSVAIGSSNQATNSFSTAIGTGNYATHYASVALGRNNQSYAGYAVCLGNDNAVNADRGFASGEKAKARTIGQFARASGGQGSAGEMQTSWFTLNCTTSDATTRIMGAENGSNGTLSTDQVFLVDDSALSFIGTVVACGPDGTKTGGWEIKGHLKNAAGTTTLPASTVTALYNPNNWAVALTAHDAHNSLRVSVTGEASLSIWWSAQIMSSEVVNN